MDVGCKDRKGGRGWAGLGGGRDNRVGKCDEGEGGILV